MGVFNMRSEMKYVWTNPIKLMTSLRCMVSTILSFTHGGMQNVQHRYIYYY